MNNLFLVINLLGGLGLFLYGMKIMGDALQNVAGNKLKGLFEKITSNPVKGIITGTIISAVIQSSSATTVMVVGFVNAGLMNLYQAAGVIFGANIGTTITGQLVALKLTKWAPLFIAIGAIIFLFNKKQRQKEIGTAILGFGILFLGMNTMSSAMVPLKDTPLFLKLIEAVGGNPLLGIAVGVLMTVMLQSSSATKGVLVVLAADNSIGIDVLLPILLGDNIGTCTTALISSIGTNKTARKAALVHLTFNIIGTTLFILLLKPFGTMVKYITPNDVGRQIANAHTLFNVTNVLIQAPFIKYLVAFVNKIIPGDEEREKMGLKYLDERILETPSIAVSQTVKEINRMSVKAKDNFEKAMKAFQSNDLSLLEKVDENEALIDLLEEEITTYLVQLSKTDIDERNHDIITGLFHIIKDIERIGDHATNIAEMAKDKIVKKIHISDIAAKQVDDMYKYTYDALNSAVEAFRINDEKKAKMVFTFEDRIDKLEEEYRKDHIKRLNAGMCNAQSSAIFLDLLNNLERIGDHSTNIAQSIINE